jgi:hypothetical protein
MAKQLGPRRSASPAHPGQALNAAVLAAQQPGIEAAARIQSGAFAASVGMHHAATLSKAADAAFRMSPMGEDVYRGLLLAYGDFAVTEIMRLSMHNGARS